MREKNNIGGKKNPQPPEQTKMPRKQADFGQSPSGCRKAAS